MYLRDFLRVIKYLDASISTLYFHWWRLIELNAAVQMITIKFLPKN